MLFLGICSFLAISCTSDKDGKDFVKCVLKQGILERAAMNIKEEPVTVTAFIAERSAGDIHDFYSEGDYWWPDTLNPDGPYVRRDGETNPDNFVAHRHAMIRFSSILLPKQMAEDGSFPLEAARTKPYGYSLFNLDAMATICQTLSDKNDNLWTYTAEGGKNMEKGINFIYPYVVDKESWIYTKDVMYWDEWPVAHPFLIFGALQTHNKNWQSTWEKLEHFPVTDEVVRNLPVRNPLIWI